MLESQKLQLRRSEISERLAELTELRAKPEGLNEEQAAEQVKLTSDFRETESAYRKAVAEEAEEETEQLRGSREVESERREIRTLLERSALMRYVASARSRTPVDGAERELNAALGLADPAPGDFPLRLLAPDPTAAPDSNVQLRADTATNLGAVATSVTPRPWLQRLFLDDTYMGFLGPCFSMDSQASGEALYTRITGGTTAGVPARGNQHDAGAMTLATATVSPQVISVAYRLDIRDRARFGSQLDAALRADMREVLREKVGDVCLSGTSLLQGLLDTAKVTTATAITVDAGTKVFSYTNLLAELAKLMNGKEAVRPADLKLLWGRPATTNLLSTLAVAETGLTQMAGLTAQGYMSLTTDRISNVLAASANLGFAARAGAGAGAFRSVIWDRGQLIVDPYTDAGKGEERISLLMQMGNVFVRPSAFVMLKAAA